MKVIAEIGLNHMGDSVRASQIAEELCRTSIDGITLQIRESAFYDGSAPHKRALPRQAYLDTAGLARGSGKQFGLSVCDRWAFSNIPSNVVDFWKTLSWVIEDIPFINELSALGKEVFVSTGLATEDSLRAVSGIPRVSFIHTQLSHAIDDINLRAISWIREVTGREVAYGQHSDNLFALYTAVAFAPSAVFFYVRPADGNVYADHEHAVPLDQVDAMANTLRTLTRALGSGKKDYIGKKIK